MTQSIKFTFFASFLLLFTSCAKKLTEQELVKLPKKKPQELIDSMDSLSRIHPQTFYSKISTSYSDTNRNVSFKTSLRMVKDSAINTLITFAKIPVASALITPDSVKIANKREKCYILQSLGYIRENFGVDFTYANLEELFLGKPVDFDTIRKYFVIHDPYNYILSSHKKRILRKLDNNRENDLKENKKDDVIIRYYLTDDARNLKRLYVDSPSDTTTIQVDYLSREDVKGFLAPKDVVITIHSPRNNIVIELTYDKTEIDEPQDMYFTIPESYEQCR